MPALYEIAQEIADALRLADESEDGEIPALLAERLDALSLTFADKADSVCRAARNYETQASVFQAEVDRLLRHRDALRAKADWLKGYLQKHMEQTGQLAVDTPLFRLRVQGNSRPGFAPREGALLVGDTLSRYVREKREFDAQKAYEDWKAGLVLPGEIVVTQGRHLRIR